MLWHLWGAVGTRGGLAERWSQLPVLCMQHMGHWTTTKCCEMMLATPPQCLQLWSAKARHSLLYWRLETKPSWKFGMKSSPSLNWPPLRGERSPLCVHTARAHKEPAVPSVTEMVLGGLLLLKSTEILTWNMMCQVSWQVELCVLWVWRRHLLNAEMAQSGCFITMPLFRVWYCRNDHFVLTGAWACTFFFCCQSCFSLLYWFSEKSPRPGELEQNCCSELQGGAHSNPASLNPLLPQQAALLMLLCSWQTQLGKSPASLFHESFLPRKCWGVFFYLAKLIHHQHCQLCCCSILVQVVPWL